MASITNTLQTPLSALEDLSLPNVLSLQEALAAVSAGFHAIADNLEGYNWFYPTAIALLVVMDVIALIYIIGIVAAWRERSDAALKKVQTWVLLPLFILLVIATTLVCSLFSIFTVMNADFCTGTANAVGTPDASVAAILDAGASPTDPAYVAVSHFTQGCTGDDPLNDMNLLSTKIDSASTARQDFLKQVKDYDVIAFSEALGISAEQLGTVLGKVLSLDESLANLDAKTSNATEVLYCPSMNAAYSDVTYNGVCDAGARALTWIFICLGAVVVSGMSVITLRVSWRDVQDFIDPCDDHDKGVFPYDDEVYDEGVEVLEEMVSYDEDQMYDADYTGAASYHDSAYYR